MMTAFSPEHRLKLLAGAVLLTPATCRSMIPNARRCSRPRGSDMRARSAFFFPTPFPIDHDARCLGEAACCQNGQTGYSIDG